MQNMYVGGFVENNSKSLCLIRQRPSPKADRIFEALVQGWPNAKINIPGDIYVLWGLIGNNAEYMKNKYIFCDMPYHGRLQGENYDESYWRWCYNGIHDNRQLNVPSDRFDNWNIKVEPYKTDGDYILVCPSSETMTRHEHGIGVEEWIAVVERQVRKHTNKPLKIRMKPRKNGTSGPSVAEIPIEKDLAGASALLTSTSLTAIDALQRGVPVFSTSVNSPAAWCNNRDISRINDPILYDREKLFYNLAYKQFSINEMRDGSMYEILSKLSF